MSQTNCKTFLQKSSKGANPVLCRHFFEHHPFPKKSLQFATPNPESFKGTVFGAGALIFSSNWR